MQYINNPDMLTPIMESATRSEYIYIDFNDFIRCESEGTFSAISKLIMINDPDVVGYDISLFQLVATTYTRDQLFELCTVYNPLHLIAYLIPSMPDEKVVSLYKRVANLWVSPLAYHDTRYGFIANTLLETNFVKKIYVGKEKFDREELMYLSKVFGDECNKKLIAYEGDYIHALSEHPEITFFMIRDGKDLFDIINGESHYSIKKEDLDDRYFLLSYSSCNLDLSKSPYNFKNEEIINNETNIHIYTTYLYPIDEDNDNTVG